MYTWIPSGMHVDAFIKKGQLLRSVVTGHGSFLVRYKEKVDDFRVKVLSVDKDKLETLIEFPDRVILFKTLGYDEEPEYDHSVWDDFVILDPFHAKVHDSLKRWFPWMMTSIREGRAEHPSRGIPYIYDSGGALLKTRASTYIDPVQVAKHYNSFATVGVALDIPPLSFAKDRRTDSIRTLAFGTSRVNNELTAALNPEIDMINVVHGFTVDQFNLWMDIVERPRYSRGWAMGTDSPLDAENLMGLLTAIQRYGRDLHYHIFALGGVTRMPAWAWLGRYIENFSADSANAFFGARAGMIYLFDLHSNKVSVLRRKKVKYNLKDGSIAKPSVCNCPVCSSIGYWNIMGRNDHNPVIDRITRSLSISHNIFTLQAYARYLDSLVKSSSIEDFLALVDNPYTRGMVHMIEDFMAGKDLYSIEEEIKKFAWKKADKKMIFSSPKEEKTLPAMDSYYLEYKKRWAEYDSKVYSLSVSHKE